MMDGDNQDGSTTPRDFDFENALFSSVPYLLSPPLSLSLSLCWFEFSKKTAGVLSNPLSADLCGHQTHQLHRKHKVAYIS